MEQRKMHYGIERHEHDDTTGYKENWYSTEWFATREERDAKLEDINSGAYDNQQVYEPNVTISYRKVKIVSDN